MSSTVRDCDGVEIRPGDRVIYVNAEDADGTEWGTVSSVKDGRALVEWDDEPGILSRMRPSALAVV